MYSSIDIFIQIKIPSKSSLTRRNIYKCISVQNKLRANVVPVEIVKLVAAYMYSDTMLSVV